MMPWALGSRLQRRRILACSILLAVLACAALPGVSDASRKFRGNGFSTIVPSGWKTGKGKHGHHARLRRRFAADQDQASRPNTTQLGVNVIPVTDFERQLGRKTPVLARGASGRSRDARRSRRRTCRSTAPFRTTTLGGRARGVRRRAVLPRRDHDAAERRRSPCYRGQRLRRRSSTSTWRCSTRACRSSPAFTATGTGARRRGQPARARSFARTSSENCWMNRDWSGPGAWSSRSSKPRSR